MEARKITVVSTKTQKKSVIMSGAETLGELKKDLREAGIDYEDMTFYEGTSRIELKTDESILPKDVPYTNRTTGETKNTNELVFMLTNTNKKIKSGAMSRAEAYSTIKAQGLQSACVAMFGKNFTQCSTNDLITLINNASNRGASPVEVETPKVETHTPVVEYVDAQARVAITTLVNALYDDGSIETETRDEVLDILRGGVVSPIVSENYKPDSSSPYSDNEIDDMFRDMC